MDSTLILKKIESQIKYDLGISPLPHFSFPDKRWDGEDVKIWICRRLWKQFSPQYFRQRSLCRVLFWGKIVPEFRISAKFAAANPAPTVISPNIGASSHLHFLKKGSSDLFENWQREAASFFTRKKEEKKILTCKFSHITTASGRIEFFEPLTPMKTTRRLFKKYGEIRDVSNVSSPAVHNRDALFPKISGA